MECDPCGRYRPSSDVAPTRDPDGRLVMACTRCRRLETERHLLASPARLPATPTALGAAILVAPR